MPRILGNAQRVPRIVSPHSGSIRSISTPTNNHANSHNRRIDSKNFSSGSVVVGSPGSLDFNGIDEDVNFGNQAALDRNGATQASTIGFRFKIRTVSTFSNFASKRDIAGTSKAGWEYGFFNGNVVTELAASATQKVEITWNTSLVANTWYDGFWVNDGTGTVAGSQLFIDKVLQTKGTTVDTLGGLSTVNTADVILGARNNGGLRYDGLLNRATYWNRALTQTDVNNYFGVADLTGASGLVWQVLFSTTLIPGDSATLIYSRPDLVLNGVPTNMTASNFSLDVPP